MGFTSAGRRFWPAVRRREREPSPPREPVGDELRELAETFRQTVGRLSSLLQEVEQAHEAALQAEIEKKQFYREVICSVTQGRFSLVDREDMPELGELAADLPCSEPDEYAPARHAIHEAARAAGMSEARADDLVLAAAEAITNAVKHAAGGRCRIYRSADSVLVRIMDRGTGIQSRHLPAAILQRGFSTKVSLGMGYTMMLNLCDRVWLSTGPEGTAVQIEKRIEPLPEEDTGLLGAWERL